MLEFLESLVDKRYANEPMKNFNMRKLREACYWLHIDKYERKQVNQYLKLYANQDDRWQEAFDEVIIL